MPFKLIACFFLLLPLNYHSLWAQGNSPDSVKLGSRWFPASLTGIASFYSDHFEGRKTSNGEIFSQKKMTCACNRLPLGTYIKVINLKNNKEIILKVNDRLHPKNKRLVDLTRTAASKLGFIKMGLTRVRVEVLGFQKPEGY